MPSRDIRPELDVKVSVAPQSIGGAVNGTGVDLAGAEAALIVLANGAATTPATVKIQESTDNSTFTDVADTDLIGLTGNTSGVAQTASRSSRSPTSAPSATSASSRPRAPRRSSAPR
jgi:hypothetical protein